MTKAEIITEMKEKFNMSDADVKKAQEQPKLNPVKKNSSVECFGCGS